MNTSKGFLLFLVALLVVLSAMLVRPFLQYVLMALLLGYVLHPLQTRLEPRVGASISATVLMIGATVAVVLPFVIMIALIASDAMQLAQRLGQDDLPIDQIESTIAQRTGMDVTIAETARASVERVANALLGSAPDLFGAIVHVLVGVGLAAFLLFFLLRDGDRLIAWLRDVTPLPADVQDDLYAELDHLTWAVLVGHVLVAIVQGVLAGLGLIATGVPNAVFWTFVMVVLSLIPVIGSFLVWAPAAMWLAATGSTAAAAALFVWGTVVVGASDNFLRPLIAGRVAVNPSIIIVGVIGGMYVFGFMGLFVGPIIIGALKIVVELFDEHYHDLDPRAT